MGIRLSMCSGRAPPNVVLFPSNWPHVAATQHRRHPQGTDKLSTQARLHMQGARMIFDYIFKVSPSAPQPSIPDRDLITVSRLSPRPQSPRVGTIPFRFGSHRVHCPSSTAATPTFCHPSGPQTYLAALPSSAAGTGDPGSVCGLRVHCPASCTRRSKAASPRTPRESWPWRMSGRIL